MPPPFPTLEQGKSFIYRGAEVERLGDFVAKLRTRFPGAQIIHSQEIPEIGKGQYIHVRPCKPVQLPSKVAKSVGETVRKLPNRHAPPSLRKFAENNDVRTFVYMRPFRKGQKSDNEFRVSLEFPISDQLEGYVDPTNVCVHTRFVPLFAAKVGDRKNNRGQNSLSIG
jgi:hypothetical protein